MDKGRYMIRIPQTKKLQTTLHDSETLKPVCKCDARIYTKGSPLQALQFGDMQVHYGHP